MRKVLLSVLFILVLFVVAPVMARPIGPQKAEKNPNIVITPAEVILRTPGGVQNEWRDTETGLMDFFHILNASKVEIPSATDLTKNDFITLLTDPNAALEFENKWCHISRDVLVELLVLMGFSEDAAKAYAAMWPEGMYFRYVNVGK